MIQGENICVRKRVGIQLEKPTLPDKEGSDILFVGRLKANFELIA